MSDAQPRRACPDDRADLRLAAMVAEHERRKWSIVAAVVALLDTLGERVGDARCDDSADGRRR
jgi:hypothetical protein